MSFVKKRYVNVRLFSPLLFLTFVFAVCQWKTIETRYADREWDDDEMALFEDAVLTHGAELRTVRDEVGTRTIYDVVRYYGHWKKYSSNLHLYPTV